MNIAVAVVAASAMFASCRGQNELEEVPEGVVRIFADKTSIAADGAEMVTFTVMYGSENITNSKSMNICRSYNGDNEVRMAAGENTFTTTTPGYYTFRARYYYDGAKYSDNTITVEVSALYEEANVPYYQKQVALMFTSVGCTGCPALAKTMAELRSQEGYADKVEPLAFHVDFQVEDPMAISASASYHRELNGNGYPHLNINLITGHEFQRLNPNLVKQELAWVEENYPTTCGVAIETEWFEDSRQLSIRSKITSNTAVAYRYLVFIVEDGIEYTQFGVEGDYVHNNVVRMALSSNLFGDKLNDGMPLAPTVECSASNTITLTRDINVENTRVVVAALTSRDNDYVVNNAAVCKAGESVDYVYISQE